MERARSEKKSIAILALSRHRPTSHVNTHVYINVQDARLRLCKAAAVAVGNTLVCSVLQCASHCYSVLHRDALFHSGLCQTIRGHMCNVVYVTNLKIAT